MNRLQTTSPSTGKHAVQARHPEKSKELLDISCVHAFVRVAECGGIARASKELLLSPSSVSRSIQQIEEYLGVPLLERRSRGSFLSSYGQQVFPRARKAISELHSIARITNGKTKDPIDSAGYLLSTRRLQMFVKLCELRHMPSVGNELGISQPAISQGIKILETGIGSALFERSALGLLPTRLAMAMELGCRRALKELSNMPAEIEVLRGSLQGAVTIGAIPLGRPLILPDAIAEVANRHTSLRVVIREDPIQELVSGLRSDDIDFIFGPLLLLERKSRLRTESLFEEDVALLVGENNRLLKKRVVLKDLVKVRWVLPRKSAPARQLLNSAFKSAGLPPPIPIVESEDLTIIRGLLAKTDMVTALLSHQMAYEIEEGSVKRLPNVFDDTLSEIGFLYPAENIASPAARVMMDAIRRIARKQNGSSAKSLDQPDY